MPDRPHPGIHPGAIATTTTPTSQAGLDAVAELAAQLGVDSIRAFASTFAAFLTRAHDFMRMGAISGVDLRLVGSHAGVEIGADSPSQMGLEDLAMLRAVHGSTVLYPSDAANTAALVEAMASTPGMSYLRTTRAPTRSCTRRERRSRSAAPRCCAQATTTR